MISRVLLWFFYDFTEKFQLEFLTIHFLYWIMRKILFKAAGLKNMDKKIIEIKKNALDKIKVADDSKTLEELRIHYLGKKGEFTSILKMLGELPAEKRPLFGAKVNEAKIEIEDAIKNSLKELKNRELNEVFLKEKIDITLKGRIPAAGTRHPLLAVQDQIEDIFLGMGFDISEGPEIESEYYNFEALNIPASHPVRDAQDSLFVMKNNLLLRTQTSPVQIRTMEKKHPNPIRSIFPGKVFRRDMFDASHSPQFHQVEGLVIDRDVKFSDLIGVLELFAKRMFGEEFTTRVRPGFFPFTEPSAEVDVSCIICMGKGCPTCKNSGWLEILGSGSVHPKVLKFGGYDPEVFTGYAFGMGVERIAMLKYGVHDIRFFFENDMRFIEQFR